MESHYHVTLFYNSVFVFCLPMVLNDGGNYVSKRYKLYAMYYLHKLVSKNN